MERWESLKPGGYRFVFDEGLFPPGTDTFLLSSFPRLKAGQRVCDLGCSTGLLSLLLLQRQDRLQVTGIDIHAQAIALARRAAEENQLTESLSFAQLDLRRIQECFPAGSFDLVICNPPYYPPHTGKLSADAARRTARAETDCTLEDVCRAAEYLLRWGGSFCLVHKPQRLSDVLCAMRQSHLEAKRLQFVCQQAGKAPSLLLAEGRRGGKPGLQVEKPLILQNADGTDTPEYRTIYFRQEDAP